MRIELLPSRSLDETTREGVAHVFAASFETSDPDRIVDRYASTVDQIFVAREGGDVVGFQFFQERRVGGRPVLHFSLAGRLADRCFRGIQAKFGHLLIRRALLHVAPWRPMFLAGVTNSPRSYNNMRAVGGRCFPDVLAPERGNPFGSWYAETAAHLGISAVSARGLVPDRMHDLGYALRPESASSHPVARAYDDYVSGNRDDGLFVVVQLVPLRDLPPYLVSRLRKGPRRGGTSSESGATAGGSGAMVDGTTAAGTTACGGVAR